MKNVERWTKYEVLLEGPKKGNPFIDVDIKGIFRHKSKTVEVDGFYDGDGRYIIRFMPGILGEWEYTTVSNCSELDGITGIFNCTPAKEENHGMVRVNKTYHFCYDDGTPYYPIGTTCYVWNLQGEELEETTLETLEKAPFNKIRMCVFPKDYDYNKNEPECYPFEGSIESGWDYTRFNPVYFRHLEKRIEDLLKLGIQADLILFHPYDRWNFSNMALENDKRYLKYIIARLSSYRNVWWSIANEYDLFEEKDISAWESIGNFILQKDPYQHLRSIHNCRDFYDHSRPWITHCSIQRQDIYRTAEYTNDWRERYKKPVIIDECAYEGNINHGWGNISGKEMTRRFWEATVRGGYCGHGETYVDENDILWWSKGGILKGDSPKRIAFLKKVIEEYIDGEIDMLPSMSEWDSICGGKDGKYYLFYFSFMQPSFRIFQMPEGLKFRVDIIDTWNMTIKQLAGTYEGNFKLKLPGRPYIAVLMRRV